MKKERILEGLLIGVIGFFAISGLFGLFNGEEEKPNLYNTVGNNVVRLYGEKGGGTGFHVKAPSGNVYILTNAHVCSLHEDHFIKVDDGENRITKRRIIEIYDEHDLCLVEGFENVQGVSVASNIQNGQKTFLVGHPLLKPLVVTEGRYIFNRNIKVFDCSLYPTVIPFGDEKPVKHSACIKNRLASNITNYSRPGSSGSPLVNVDGKLVGVLFAGNLFDANDSYAVPLDAVKHFLSVY